MFAKYFVFYRAKSFLALAVAQTTQKLSISQAAYQEAREPTHVPALKHLVLESLPCIAIFTTGSVQPNAKKKQKKTKKQKKQENLHVYVH